MINPLIRRSVLAGALIAMGCLFSMAAAPYGPVVQGLCFSVGLFGVLTCNARLFTGGILSTMDLWGHRIGFGAMCKTWTTTWAGNLAGALCVALMASQTGVDATGIAAAKAATPWHELLIRAGLCNVMVCMAVHVYHETWRSGWERNRSSSLVLDALASCVLPVACFVACGFEHSVADMLHMPLGVMQGAVDVWQCVYVIGLATVGNVMGGVVFAALVWEG